MRRLLTVLAVLATCHDAFAQRARPADPQLLPVPRANTQIATWDEAIALVRAKSTDLHIAQQSVAAAEANSRVALAGVLPSITGTGAYTHNLVTRDTLQFGRDATGKLSTTPVRTPFPDYLNGSIVATQPVFAPRAWYAIGTAGTAEDAARLSLDDAKRRIALGVATAIVAVVAAEHVCELNRAGLTNALARLDLADKKTGLGGGTGLDLARAKEDVEAARAVLIAGDESLRQAREALGLALGIPEQVGVTEHFDLDRLDGSARASCKQVGTVEARPDVAAAHETTNVAHRGVGDVKMQFAPTIGLQSTVATTTIDTGAAPNTTWNVQAILSVPIWDGGARYGQLRAAEAGERQASETEEQTRRSAIVEIEQARRGVAVADDRRRVAANARDLALQVDKLTRAAYVEGHGTSLELVAAAQALREAEIELALRDFDLVRARVVAVLVKSTCGY